MMHPTLSLTPTRIVNASEFDESTLKTEVIGMLDRDTSTRADNEVGQRHNYSSVVAQISTKASILTWSRVASKATTIFQS